ncbi:MAG: DUF6364 family protein [Chlorobium sp.]
MLAKLTLTIDDEVISRAKIYAQRKQRSVSKIVEEYLKNVSDIDRTDIPTSQLDAEITNRITGMFKENYSGESYKEILSAALMEKLQ